MKKILLLILMFCFLLSGCSQKIEQFLETPVYPNLSGEYVMVTDNVEENIVLPKITYNDYTKEFVFTYDFLSSYLPIGKVKQEGKKMIMETEDKKYKYVFEIINTYTLKFIASESSSTKLTNDSIGIEVEDGTIFQIPGESEKLKEYRKNEMKEEDDFIYWAY